MKISDNGFKLVSHYDKFIDTAYKNDDGIPEIGWRHIKSIKKNDIGKKIITKEQGLALLKKDMAYYEKAISKLVAVPLTQHQFDSLVNFVFDVGIELFQASTLLLRLNNGEYNCVPSQMMRLHRNQNIGKLKAEGILFSSGELYLESEDGHS